MKTYKYYEIIDSYPHILKSKIPLVEIIRAFAYYSVLFFIFFKNVITLNFEFFKKKTEVSNFTFSKYFPDLQTVQSETKFLSKKESIEKLNLLISEFSFKKAHLLSKNFTIKETTETFTEDLVPESKTFIFINYFKFADTIKKYTTIKGQNI